jgi:ribosomal protein L31E
MAEKDERIIIIPLRAGLQKEPRADRTKRAIYEIRQHVVRHAKVGEVKVSKGVNEALWVRGKKKPQAKIKVKLIVSEGVAKVLLPDEKEEVKKKEAPKGAVEALREKMTGGAKPAAKHEHTDEHAHEHAHEHKVEEHAVIPKAEHKEHSHAEPMPQEKKK